MIDFIVFALADSMSVLGIALGFHLIFGLGGVVFLCYGAFITLAAYFVAVLYKLGAGFVPAILSGVVLTCILSYLFYKTLLSRVQGILLSEALICIAFMLIVRDSLALVFGTSPFTFPGFWPDKVIVILGSYFSLSRLGLIVTVPFLCLAVWLFLRFSALGRSMRALSQDREAGLLMGIVPGKMIARMVLVSTLVSIIGAFLVLSFLNLTPDFSEQVLLQALFAVILGGLGNLKGLILASFIIGFSTTATAMTLGSQLKLLLPLIIIFGILIWRPSGMFGMATKLEERI